MYYTFSSSLPHYNPRWPVTFYILRFKLHVGAYSKMRGQMFFQLLSIHPSGGTRTHNFWITRVMMQITASHSHNYHGLISGVFVLLLLFCLILVLTCVYIILQIFKTIFYKCKIKFDQYIPMQLRNNYPSLYVYPTAIVSTYLSVIHHCIQMLDPYN